MNQRYFTRKPVDARIHETKLLQELQENLPQLGLKSLSIYTIYEIFEGEAKDFAAFEQKVLASTGQEEIWSSGTFDIPPERSLTRRAKGGQFDQRADVARTALRLVVPDSTAQVTSSDLFIWEADSDLSDAEIKAELVHYLINPVVEEESDLSELSQNLDSEERPLANYCGFLDLDEAGLVSFLEKAGLAMALPDLKMIQEEFRKYGRVPTEVEIKVLDTYWSDHCRHTTFNTRLTSIENRSQRFKQELDHVLALYRNMREANQRKQPPTLMDLATIQARDLRRQGGLANEDRSDEINACTVNVDVERAGKKEPWLFYFKNETHNHPTEIEPFGGAGTCLGGGIRDPLSGRAKVYQSMRITGASDVNTPYQDTLPTKHPQAYISKQACLGYSDYANQIGLAGTYARELYHPGYVAKRMELGALTAAAPKQNVTRKQPKAGDVVVLVGGRTGRDGIGGATGSSKALGHQRKARYAAEVQKGNPPIEANITRLFARPDVAPLILKCNDFGAGGVSVAVGELADSLDIDLDQVKCKYPGMNAMEIAISESQERMACLLDAGSLDDFLKACREEDLEAVALAKVTDSGYLRMTFRGETVFEIARSFMDTNGAERQQTVILEDKAEPVRPTPCALKDLKKDALLAHLAAPNHGSQRGLLEHFDDSVGRTTLLAPLGGLYQKTEELVSAQTFPVQEGTSTVSLMAAGYDPTLADNSPYLMGAYSLIESLSRLVAAGINYHDVYLSNQEFFRRLESDPVLWGNVVQALLGLLEAEKAFGLASIGGKDSMSGSFEDIHVPDTLASFTVAVSDSSAIISACLPQEKAKLLYLPHNTKADLVPDYEELCHTYSAVAQFQQTGQVLAASAIRKGGLAETLTKMALGNQVGIRLASGLDDLDMFTNALGGIVLAVPETADLSTLSGVPYREIGRVEPEQAAIVWQTGLTTSLDEVEAALNRHYEKLFPTGYETPAKALPDFAKTRTAAPQATPQTPTAVTGAAAVKVLLPIFFGDNGAGDLQAAFARTGATCETLVMRRLNSQVLAEDQQSFIQELRQSHILAVSGSYVLGDYPGHAAHYLSLFLGLPAIRQALQEFVERGGLILGIDSGFQALINTGLLPFGTAGKPQTGIHFNPNPQGRHFAGLARVQVRSNRSPWLRDLAEGSNFVLPLSTSEGSLQICEGLAEKLFADGQIAGQFVDASGKASLDPSWNPLAAAYAVEAMTSPDGRILGKLSHAERAYQGLFKNVPGHKDQDIFRSAVRYVVKEVL